MTANIVIHRDPFRPHLNVENKEIEHGLTIERVLSNDEFLVFNEEGELIRVGAYVVFLNGEAILAKDWQYELAENDVIQVAIMPKGGGGGSSVGNILMAIVIAVAAYFTMGLSLVATAAVGVAALAVLSLSGAVVPPPTSSNGVGESRSPTYSLSAQGNNARLLEAIPRVYGRVRTYPDLASQPYSDYQGNQQYLYQLFCVSVGEVEFEKILVDETDIDSFEDAEYQIIRPGQAVTLFADNVVTSDAVQSLEMFAPNNPNYNVLGPFVSAPAGTKTNKIAVDVALPQGAGTIGATSTNLLAYTLSVLFEYRSIDDNGTPLGLWTSLVTRSFTLATKNPQIYSLEADVALGRYEVRGYRTSVEGDSTTFGMLQWLSLRAYLPSTHIYGNVTLLAVKMRATGALNSTTARKFSTITTGMVQKWNPIDGYGALVVTTNPIWCAVDALRNADYGRGLLTERFNITNFYRLAQVCDTRGDTFNGVFDTTTQLWSALTQICRVFRAVPVYYAGVIDIIRDEPASLPTQVFVPGKMVSGTFKTNYSFFDVDTPDHVIIEYIDRVTWKTATVACLLPGETALKPKTVKFFGIDNREQAWREGISMAAANRDRRRSLTFQTLKTGLIPQYNGLVRVSHDVPQWGYNGRVLEFDKVSGNIVTSEPIILDPASTNLIAFRSRNGSENGPYTLTSSPLIDELNGVFVYKVNGTSEQLNSIYISSGVREDYTFYTAGPSTRRGILALVMSANPSSDGKVSLVMVNYADSVHSAENGGVVPPPPPESELPGVPSAPIVNTVTVVYTVAVGEQNIVASPANGAIYYEFQAKISSSSDWLNLGTSDRPTLVTNLNPGTWSVRVRGVGINPGPWTTWNGVIEATSLPVPKLDLMSLSSDLFSIGISLSYEAATASIAGNAEIWVGVTNVLGNASRLARLPYPANKHVMTDLRPGERRYFWGRVIDTAGRVGPWYNNGTPLTEIASIEKTASYLEQSIGESQLTAILREKINTPQVDLTPVYTAISNEATQRINGDSANASQITQVSAVANGAKSDAQLAITATATIDGKISSTIALRTQGTRPDGKIVTSGVAVGVTPNSAGELVSEIILASDRIAFIRPGFPNDPLKYMLVAEGDDIFINSLFVKKATITNALIGATLSSVDVDSQGNPVLVINFQTGSIISRGINNLGRTDRDNLGERVYDAAGTLRVRSGIWQ